MAHRQFKERPLGISSTNCRPKVIADVKEPVRPEGGGRRRRDAVAALSATAMATDRLFSRRARVGRSALPALLLGSGSLAPRGTGEGDVAERIRALRAEAKAHEHGEGVARDEGTGGKLYCEAARLGMPNPNTVWLDVYANGRGVPRHDPLVAYLPARRRAGNAMPKRMLRLLASRWRKTRVPEGSDDPDGRDLMAASRPTARNELVYKLAPQYGVIPRLAPAVIHAESNFNPGAVSPECPGPDAAYPGNVGPVQIKRPFDPEENIRGGVVSPLAARLLQGNVSWLRRPTTPARERSIASKGVSPYEETRGYVKRIVETFQKDEHPFDPTVTDPSPSCIESNHQIDAGP